MTWPREAAGAGFARRGASLNAARLSYNSGRSLDAGRVFDVAHYKSVTARDRERISHSASAFIAASACGWPNSSFGSSGKRCI